jgi:hypothetical protein|tara:strand:+ start:807 stop:1022 length:216 start_codon:yes stop_codon:yes gene_type:complete
MAIELKQLGLLPIEEQESILNGMLEEYHPIEVNGKKFMIPFQVNELIDDLFIELNDLKIKLEERGIGESEN